MWYLNTLNSSLDSSRGSYTSQRMSSLFYLEIDSNVSFGMIEHDTGIELFLSGNELIRVIATTNNRGPCVQCTKMAAICLYKARHAHKCLYTVLPKYSKIQVLPGITSCRLVKDNKQAIELNSLLLNNMPKDGYE